MESVKVLRKQEIETKEIKVGDQLLVSLLEGFGDFTVTAHKITDKGILFIFDECVTIRPMNIINTNRGGFEESDLKDWINSVLLEVFPEELRNRISDLSIPTVGELFGHDDGWSDGWNNEHFEPDEEEELPLMKERRKRVAYFKNKIEWWWLRNATKRNIYASDFALVDGHGYAYYGIASTSNGVRPEFWLVK